MFYIRNLADEPGFWNWPRELFYNDADRRVWLQMNHNNRDQDWVMYEKMKKQVEMLWLLVYGILNLTQRYLE